MFVVPNPTLLTFKNSLSTFSKSPTTIEVIPAKDRIEVDIETCPLTLPDSVVVIGVNDIGDWITLSRVINAFSFFLNISSLCLSPDPALLKVIAAPALVVDNWNTFELTVPDGWTT